MLFVQDRHAVQGQANGIRIAGPLALLTQAFGVDEGHPERRCKALGYARITGQLGQIRLIDIHPFGHELPAGGGVVQLNANPDLMPAFRTLPSRTYRTPSSLPTWRTSTDLPLNVKAVFRAMTKLPGMRDRSVVKSSVIPS